MQSTSEGFSLLINILPLLLLGLPVLAWIALYARGAEARDLLFWGAIAVVIPLLGPIAAVVFAFRLQSYKTKPSSALRG